MTAQSPGAAPPALDHIRLSVTDYALSRAFYDAALEPLGIRCIADLELPDGHRACGYGRGDEATFWFSSSGVSRGQVHIAFQARNRAEVRAFHEAALAVGGRDHGAPGLRPGHHADYYAAFVYDPDGYNIEAVSQVHEDDAPSA